MKATRWGSLFAFSTRFQTEVLDTCCLRRVISSWLLYSLPHELKTWIMKEIRSDTSEIIHENHVELTKKLIMKTSMVFEKKHRSIRVCNFDPVTLQKETDEPQGMQVVKSIQTVFVWMRFGTGNSANVVGYDASQCNHLRRLTKQHHQELRAKHMCC